MLKTRLQTAPERYSGIWDCAWKARRSGVRFLLLPTTHTSCQACLGLHATDSTHSQTTRTLPPVSEQLLYLLPPPENAAWRIADSTFHPQVIKTEGPFMLLQGLGPTAAGYCIQGGLKYGVYELLKSTAASATGAPAGAHDSLSQTIPSAYDETLQNFGHNSGHRRCPGPAGSHLALSMLLILAAASEFVGSSALCPYEAARIRLVVEPTYATGAPLVLSPPRLTAFSKPRATPWCSRIAATVRHSRVERIA